MIKENTDNLDSHRILIIGTEELGQLIIRYLISNSNFISKPIGVINTKSETKGRRLHGVPILGTIDKTIEIIETKRITDVITTLDHSDKNNIEIKQYCHMHNIEYRNASLNFN